MRRSIQAAAILALAASPAWADCPAPGALEQGIAVTAADGTVETFKQIAPGRVENTTNVGEDEGSYYILAQGIYLRALTDMENGALKPASMTTYNYPLEDAQMPRPVAQGIWQVEVAILEGGNISTELHDIRFGAETRMTIGACGYNMIPVSIRVEEDGETSFEETLYYLPELGFAIYGAYAEPEKETELYTYKSIGMMQD
ncbi:MAG: hypothetical protein AAFY38_07745 [Pseudomonadota bacterium]